METDIYQNCLIINRENYGWKTYQRNNIKLWICGYINNVSIENLQSKITNIIDNDLKNNDLLHFIDNLRGHFAFVIEYNSYVVASVDKICSIPLFFSKKNNNVLISNHAPLLKKRCKLSDIDKQAELEIAMSGFTIGSKTLYFGIERLESGNCLIFKDGLLNINSYYSYSPWKVVFRDKNYFHREFSDICLNIFKQIKDSSMGRQIVVPLSAGNDSRLVVSALKEVGAENVVCFSYGRKGSFEIPISKSIANKLGYRWVYIRDCLKDKRKFFKSKAYLEYTSAFNSFAYTHSVQEVYEVFLLHKKNLIDSDAIFINGNSGDFISGGHIRSMTDVSSSPKTLDEISWSKFLDKHYSLWGNLRNSVNDSAIITEIKKELLMNIEDQVDIENYHYAIMEHLECLGRQSKIVIGQQRTYDYFGYEWRLPFWSDEIFNFWSTVPIEYKIDQNLYLEVLKRNNWGDVWLDIKVNDKVIYPLALKWLRIAFKVLFIPLGKSRWHRFEKNVLEYFLCTTYALTVTSYLDVLFDIKGYRGTNSWLSRKMIQSKKLGTDT